LLWQPLHLGNDRFFAPFCIVFTVETLRCIWATSFEKVLARRFLVLHEAVPADNCCVPAVCLTGKPNGGGEA
jgi:hypothetical protein